MTDLAPSQVSECERERLANSGLIQPHGALLFVDRPSGVFRYVSVNAESLLGEAGASLLGRDGRDWLEQYLPTLIDLPTNVGRRRLLPGALDLGAGELDVLVSPHSAGWILEFEPAVVEEDDPGAHRLQVPAPPIDAVRLRQLEQSLVETVSAVTGFDRVMLYRFHPDWSGEVLAETVRRSAGTYLGLRFPASDIPAIARGLYAQTPYRHIPDAAAPPVPLQGSVSDGTQLDLTWCDLRSVSPVHAEYLHNMKVRASFSVSVIVDGQLWGLIACHHPEPKRISLKARQQCRDLAAEFAVALQGVRKGAQRDLYEALTARLAPIEVALTQGVALPEAMTREFPALGALFGAAAAFLVIDQDGTPLGEARGEAHDEAHGEAGPSAALRTLHQWCLRNQGDPVWALDHLPPTLREALGADPHSFRGVLSVALRARRRSDALVSLYLLRPEEATEIAWAGDPEKPLEAAPDGLRLSPRHSFERWVEVRHGHSRPWSEDDLFVARQLRDRLLAWL